MAPKKLAKLFFNFDVDAKTSLAIQPLLGNGKQTKLTIDRKFKHGIYSATLYDKTATLAATVSGLKPVIGINLEDPLKSKPTFKLTYAFSS